MEGKIFAPKTVSKMLESGRHYAISMAGDLSAPKTVSKMRESRRLTAISMAGDLSAPKTVSKMLERRRHYAVYTGERNYALIPAQITLESRRFTALNMVEFCSALNAKQQ